MILDSFAYGGGSRGKSDAAIRMPGGGMGRVFEGGERPYDVSLR